MSNLEDLLASAGLELVSRNAGNGGSASVHKCRVNTASPRLPSVGAFVAAKEYRSEVLRAPNQRQRIRQEADLGSRLQHANLVQTLGLLGDDAEGSGPLVLLLEWVDGLTLDQWYAAVQRPVGWEPIREAALGLVSALTELHRAGVHHRDVKPENVMVRSADSTVVLMDIGIAELATGDEATLHTSLRDFIGSARYASPQFILGTAPFAPADDVYSLGATLFLLMTGTPIFGEIERKSVLPIAVVNSQPELRGLADGVPASMKVLLQGMLHREPTRRPTLNEVRESLENLDGASYVTKELARQSTDVRSYRVISVDGRDFFADLAGGSPKLDETYTIVRPAKKALTVPSYGRDVTPEVWVGEATLKHVHQNVGHFATHYQRWQEPRSTFASLGFARGEWIHDEGNERSVSTGDLVLRKSNT